LTSGTAIILRMQVSMHWNKSTHY